LFRITPFICILGEVNILYIFCFIFRDLLTFSQRVKKWIETKNLNIISYLLHTLVINPNEGMYSRAFLHSSMELLQQKNRFSQNLSTLEDNQVNLKLILKIPRSIIAGIAQLSKWPYMAMFTLLLLRLYDLMYEVRPLVDWLSPQSCRLIVMSSIKKFLTVKHTNGLSLVEKSWGVVLKKIEDYWFIVLWKIQPQLWQK